MGKIIKCSNCGSKNFSVWTEVKGNGIYTKVIMCDYCGLTRDLENGTE